MRRQTFLLTCLSLCMFGAEAQSALLVDFEAGPLNTGLFDTEQGYVSINAPAGAAPADVGVTRSTSDNGITLTIGATGGGYLAGRNGSGSDRGGPLDNLTQEDLQGDLIAARNGDGGMTLTFDGLSIGEEYTLTAFHNDANGGNSGFATPGASVTPSIVSGAVLVGTPTVGAHSNLSRPGTPTFSGPYTDADLSPSIITFEAQATTVDLLLTSGAGNNFLPVSGLTLVIPEPASFALLGVACFGLAAARRRS